MNAEFIHRLATTVLTRVRGCLRQLRSDDEDGQGLVEYGLILILIAIVVIAILAVVGHQVNNIYSNITNGLNQ